MPGLFDRVQKRIQEIQAAETTGISPLHLRDLQPELRRIMRLLLREIEMTYAEIQAEAQNWPEDQQLNGDDLHHALNELTKQNWLIRMGEGEIITYKVNLRRRAASNLGQDIWGNLNSRVEQFAAEVKSTSPPDSDEPTP